MSSGGENWQLRVRTPGGQHTINTVRGTDTIGDLKSIIWSMTNYHPDNCRVLVGYPPEERFLIDNDQLVKEIFPSRREVITLEGSPDSSKEDEAMPVKVLKPVIREEPRRTMMRIEVPANNSCLFVSVYYCMTGELKERCPELRDLIANTVASDPIRYNEGFLGKPNTEYCTWIRNEDHWGGGIELDILSNHFKVEIVGVDTQNLRFNRFGEDQDYNNRILLIFDGIHYDALAVATNDLNNPLQLSFPIQDETVLEMALDFAREAKANHQYTDVNRMSLRCNQCKKSFTNEGARAHAKETSHVDFSEIVNHS